MAATGIAGAASAAAPHAVAPPAVTDATVLRDLKALLKSKAANMQEANDAFAKMERQKNNDLIVKEMELANMRGDLGAAKASAQQYKHAAEQSVICLLVACCLLLVCCVCSMWADCSYLCRFRSCRRRKRRCGSRSASSLVTCRK
jgi:hypothetical protein